MIMSEPQQNSCPRPASAHVSRRSEADLFFHRSDRGRSHRGPHGPNVSPHTKSPRSTGGRSAGARWRLWGDGCGAPRVVDDTTAPKFLKCFNVVVRAVEMGLAQKPASRTRAPRLKEACSSLAK